MHSESIPSASVVHMSRNTPSTGGSDGSSSNFELPQEHFTRQRQMPSFEVIITQRVPSHHMLTARESLLLQSHLLKVKAVTSICPRNISRGRDLCHLLKFSKPCRIWPLGRPQPHPDESHLQMTCMMTTGPVHHGNNRNLATLHWPLLLNLLPQVSHFMEIPEAQKESLIGEVNKEKNNLSHSCPSLTGWSFFRMLDGRPL